MQYFEDYISNTSDDNDNIWIHRLQYSTIIRAYVKVGEYGEEDEIMISSEDNQIILDAIYNMYLVEKTLNNQEVVLDPHGKVDRNMFHPLYEKSFDKIYKVILKLKDEIYAFEQYKREDYSYQVTLKKLRYVLITIIQVYLAEFPTYSYIIRRYGSVLRKVFIDIWKLMSDEDDKILIQKGITNGKNIIRRDSEREPLSVAMVYIAANNRIVKSVVSYPRKKYLIDVKDLTCDCPDFVHRKYKQGLLCKHLMKFQNECKCMVYLNRIVKDNLYNVPCPMKKMLRIAYDEGVSF